MRLLWSMVACILLMLPAVGFSSQGKAFIASTATGGASNMPCSVVADRAQVRFRIHGLGSPPRQMQVLLNGEPVPSNQVVNSWPTIKFDGGLFPGRNTVELLITTRDGRKLHRSQVVKIGNSVHSRDGIRLACRSVRMTTTDTGSYESSGASPRSDWSSAPVVVYPAIPSYVVPYSYAAYPPGWYGNLSYGWNGGWVNYGWPGPYMGFGFRWGDDDDFHHFHGWRRGDRH